ncbi:DNA repair protein RecO [Thalassotalea ponticola]|uniref:DNA repair protein RecO n=1 Tax=Thalassotalea ponticola TaxID=1523392 RepID=UPI0025B40F49|nr:DNA repair protein RecO [Thalassotalea ponticola]MDN3652120.1 DNA repair protein RecO [Thalassotalea ponticola]
MGFRQGKLQHAYLLHSRPYRDNSRLLNVFTRDEGHISVIAYSSSKGKNNKAGFLQPFAPLELELKGDGPLKILGQVEYAQKSLALKQQQLYSAFYINELLVRLLPENINADSLFATYAQTLHALNEGHPIEPTLRYFEIALLEELGQGLDFAVVDELALQHTQSTIPDNAEDEFALKEPSAMYFNQGEYYYHYRSEQGFILAENYREARYPGSHLQCIGELELTDANVLKTCKQLMRQLLNLQLGGKPLHSRRLFANYLNKGKT